MGEEEGEDRWEEEEMAARCSAKLFNRKGAARGEGVRTPSCARHAMHGSANGLLVRTASGVADGPWCCFGAHIFRLES